MQAPHGVRFDWGPVAAATLAPDSACIVIVDVLSFTTSVTIATEQGTRVYPYPWRNDTAAAFAAQKQATLAVGRRSTSPATPWSLSPAALRRAPITPRLVLPTGLRRRMVDARPPRDPKVVLTETESERIDAELAPLYARARRTIGALDQDG